MTHGPCDQVWKPVPDWREDFSGISLTNLVCGGRLPVTTIITGADAVLPRYASLETKLRMYGQRRTPTPDFSPYPRRRNSKSILKSTKLEKRAGADSHVGRNDNEENGLESPSGADPPTGRAAAPLESQRMRGRRH